MQGAGRLALCLSQHDRNEEGEDSVLFLIRPQFTVTVPRRVLSSTSSMASRQGLSAFGRSHQLHERRSELHHPHEE